MSHGDIFLLVRIAVLIAVTVFHVVAWKLLGSELSRRKNGFPPRWRGGMGMLFILMALPGVWIVFAGDIPLPSGVLTTATVTYMIWNVLLVLMTLFLFLRRLMHRRLLSGAVERDQRQETEPLPSERQPAEQQRVPAPAVDESRRTFLREGAAGLTIISLGGPLIGAVSRDDEFEVVHKSVRIRNLPKQLEGFRLAMISDIHSGPFMDTSDIDPYVSRINGLKPDAILLPGDFIQNRNEEIEPACDALQKLRAPYGVYGSTGNHDYFADADYVSKELELAGVRMLRNEHAVLDVGGAPLALIGLDDVRSGHPFDTLFRQAVKGLDARIPNVVLCHKPYYLEEASEWGVDLMVSGHTHGGQIVIARVFDAVITPAALISGYIEGLYKLDRTQLYVTRGIGTVGLPIRVNCPPEVTILTLQRA